MTAETPDLDAIRARLNLTTPGPWAKYMDPMAETVVYHVASGLAVEGYNLGGGDFDTCDGMTEEDADFIAHAREDTGILLAALAESNAGRNAEKERADKATAQVAALHAQVDEECGRADTYMRGYREAVAERDALRVRIDALTAASQPPTEAEWSERVQAARARARAKSYDDVHDREHGPIHLLLWAQDYLRRGRTDDAGGLIDSAMAVIMHSAARAGDHPEATPEHLNSCGRGVCARNDGHRGRCTT